MGLLRPWKHASEKQTNLLLNSILLILSMYFYSIIYIILLLFYSIVIIIVLLFYSNVHTLSQLNFFLFIHTF